MTWEVAMAWRSLSGCTYGHGPHVAIALTFQACPEPYPWPTLQPFQPSTAAAAGGLVSWARSQVGRSSLLSLSPVLSAPPAPTHG